MASQTADKDAAPATAAAEAAPADAGPANAVNDGGDAEDSIPVSEEALAAHLRSQGYDLKYTFRVRYAGDPSNVVTAEFLLSYTSSLHEIRVQVAEAEQFVHVTCFELYHAGVPLPPYASVATHPWSAPEDNAYVIDLVDTPYDTSSARTHLRRMRQIFRGEPSYAGPFGDGSGATVYTAVLSSTFNAADAPTSLADLEAFSLESYFPPQAARPRHIESLSLSGWNPVPAARAIQGDLFYLELTTAELELVHITACSAGFFVNKSTRAVFNPRPASPHKPYVSLFTLLVSLSPKFRAAAPELVSLFSASQAAAMGPVPIPHHPWLVPLQPHTYEADRDEGLGPLPPDILESGAPRDWNDDKQGFSTRLPVDTPEERLIRDQLLYATHCDFIDAATKGAKHIVDNPSTLALNSFAAPEDRLYTYGNVCFVTYRRSTAVPPTAADVILETPKLDQPMRELEAVTALNTAGSPLATLPTAVVDYCGVRFCAQGVMPGIFTNVTGDDVVVYGKPEAALPAYGLAGDGTGAPPVTGYVASDEGFVADMEATAKSLSLASRVLVGDDGKAVAIAGAAEAKGIVGPDKRRYLLEAVRVCPVDPNHARLKNPTVVLPRAFVDIFVVTEEMRAVTAARKEKADADAAAGKGTAAAVEGGAAAATATSADGAGAGADAAAAATAVSGAESSAKTPEQQAEAADDAATAAMQAQADADRAAAAAAKVYFNVNLGVPGVTFRPEDSALIAEDTALVARAAEMLKDKLLPMVLSELVDSTTLDYLALRDVMQTRGVSSPYLGALATMAAEANVGAVHSLLVMAMVVEAAARAYGVVIAGVPAKAIAASTAHFLNCFLARPGVAASEAELAGEAAVPVARAAKKKGRKGDAVAAAAAAAAAAASAATTAAAAAAAGPVDEAAEAAAAEAAAIATAAATAAGLAAADVTLAAAPFTAAALSTKLLWETITARLAHFNGYTAKVSRTNFSGPRREAALRAFCLLTGVQVYARPYSFASGRVFTAHDIAGIVPVVHHSPPVAESAQQMMHVAREAVGKSPVARELTAIALQHCRRLYGPVHESVAELSSLLSQLHFLCGDHESSFESLQTATVLFERLKGLDHPRVIDCYAQLVRFSTLFEALQSKVVLFINRLRLLTAVHGWATPEPLASFLQAQAEAFAELDLPRSAQLALEKAATLHEAAFDAAITAGEAGGAVAALSPHDLRVGIDPAQLAAVRSLKGVVAPRAMAVYHAIAKLLAKQSRFKEAIPWQKKSVVLAETLLGADSEAAVQLNVMLADMLRSAVSLQSAGVRAVAIEEVAGASIEVVMAQEAAARSSSHARRAQSKRGRAAAAAAAAGKRDANLGHLPVETLVDYITRG